MPGPGRSANDRDTLMLSNHPATGPMFSGPQQPDFFCSTAAHLAGFDLAGPFLDADCSLPPRVGYYYRAANQTWKPYDPAAPRPADMTQTTTSEGDTVDFVHIKRHYYVVHSDVNPTGIVPLGPALENWASPHGREALGGSPFGEGATPPSPPREVVAPEHNPALALLAG